MLPSPLCGIFVIQASSFGYSSFDMCDENYVLMLGYMIGTGTRKCKLKVKERRQFSSKCLETKYNWNKLFKFLLL